MWGVDANDEVVVLRIDGDVRSGSVHYVERDVNAGRVASVPGARISERNGKSPRYRFECGFVRIVFGDGVLYSQRGVCVWFSGRDVVFDADFHRAEFNFLVRYG